MSDDEKVAAGAAAKEKGNARFKAGKWVAALVKYKARALPRAGQDSIRGAL